jgi:DNA-directed RNA polymerase subunit beta
LPDSLVPVRDRVSFSKLDEALPLPDLVGIQRESFDWLLAEGLKEVLEEVSPIEDFTEQFQLHFGKHAFKDQKFTEEECKDKDATFSAPLFVEAMFVNKTTGEIKEQEVFMGDFPMMTERGTFIINGTERVVVSQLVRSPGVYFSRELDKTTDKDVYIAKIIPSRGAWLEFDVDKKDTVGVRIDRKRRQNVTVLLKALGWSADEILALFDQAESIKNTLEKDHVETPEEALEDIYRKLRPGEPPTAESARTLLENLFFNPKRYDLARVGRYKVNKKLEAAQGVLQSQLKARFKQLAELDNPDKKGWDQPKFRAWAELQKDEQGENGPKYKGILSYEDMLRTVRYLVKLHAGEDGYEPDDIDHFGNRRLRTVGDHASDADQHPSGGREHQGVLRHIAAVAVHGPDQPPRRADPQAPAVGARARWALARARGVRGPGRPPLALRPDVPDRDAGGPEHRPDRVALDLRAHQPVRVHRDTVPTGHGRQGHRQGRLPLG